MSNNIYDILKTMRGLDSPKATLTEGKKAKPDYLDMDKDGDKKEPMKKAVKDKSKGAIAEAVARVEQQLAEKYMGFKKTAAAVAKGGSADDPEAVAASIGRKKYGKKKFQDAAAKGKKLGEATAPNRAGQRRLQDALEDDPDMMGYHAIAALYGNDMWDNDAMGDLVNDLEQANPTPKELQYIIVNAKLPTRLKGIRFTNTDDVQFGHLGEEGSSVGDARVDQARPGMQSSRTEPSPRPQVPRIPITPFGTKPPKNEDMLSPGQKKIAKMSPPPGKIDANDLAALRAGKKKKAEGNAFSGALDAAKKSGQEKFSVDGKEYQVQEGWDEMMADVKQRSGPQPSGGSGIKAGKRYGGSAQKDEPETDNETGEVAKKGRGRPKKDKFAK